MYERATPFAMAWLFAASMMLGCRSDPPTKKSAMPPSIENVTWQLVEVGGKPAEPAPADEHAAHVRLDATSKRASGYSGVNAFQGSYQLAGTSLKFGPMAMTRRAGPEPLMQQESAFTRALTDTAAWRSAGDDQIELLDDASRRLAVLRNGDRRP